MGYPRVKAVVLSIFLRLGDAAALLDIKVDPIEEGDALGMNSESLMKRRGLQGGPLVSCFQPHVLDTLLNQAREPVGVVIMTHRKQSKADS